MKPVLAALGLAALALPTGGCVLFAAAGAGAVAADEINENDGEFDPLEDVEDEIDDDDND